MILLSVYNTIWRWFSFLLCLLLSFFWSLQCLLDCIYHIESLLKLRKAALLTTLFPQFAYFPQNLSVEIDSVAGKSHHHDTPMNNTIVFCLLFLVTQFMLQMLNPNPIFFDFFNFTQQFIPLTLWDLLLPQYFFLVLLDHEES